MDSGSGSAPASTTPMSLRSEVPAPSLAAAPGERPDGDTKRPPPQRARYKRKFLLVRKRYEEVVATHEDLKSQYQRVAARLKSIQAENDLLLDALDVAANSHPELFPFLSYVAADQLSTSPDALPILTTHAPPDAPPARIPHTPPDAPPARTSRSPPDMTLAPRPLTPSSRALHKNGMNGSGAPASRRRRHAGGSPIDPDMPRLAAPYTWRHPPGHEDQPPYESFTSRETNGRVSR